MTIPRSTRRIALIGALALAAVGAGAPAASAGESEAIHVKGGAMVFQHSGEILKAYAKQRTDYGVRAVLTWGDGIETNEPRAVLDDHSKNGEWRSENLSIPEGEDVELWLCYLNHRGAVVSCSDSQVAVA